MNILYSLVGELILGSQLLLHMPLHGVLLVEILE